MIINMNSPRRSGELPLLFAGSWECEEPPEVARLRDRLPMVTNMSLTRPRVTLYQDTTEQFPRGLPSRLRSGISLVFDAFDYWMLRPLRLYAAAIEFNEGLVATHALHINNAQVHCSLQALGEKCAGCLYEQPPREVSLSNPIDTTSWAPFQSINNNTLGLCFKVPESLRHVHVCALLDVQEQRT